MFKNNVFLRYYLNSLGDAQCPVLHSCVLCLVLNRTTRYFGQTWKDLPRYLCISSDAYQNGAQTGSRKSRCFDTKLTYAGLTICSPMELSPPAAGQPLQPLKARKRHQAASNKGTAVEHMCSVLAWSNNNWYLILKKKYQ